MVQKRVYFYSPKERKTFAMPIDYIKRFRSGIPAEYQRCSYETYRRLTIAFKPVAPPQDVDMTVLDEVAEYSRLGVVS